MFNPVFAADPAIELNLAVFCLLALLLSYAVLVLLCIMVDRSRWLARWLDEFAEHWKLFRACCRHTKSR